MSAIQFTTKLFKINSWTILRLPEDSSAMLPSRGTVMIKGTINGAPFKTLLEPDGRYGPGQKPSHWFKIESSLQKEAKAHAGDLVTVELETTSEWINPELPPDMKKALTANKEIHKFWNSTTPLAKWEWMRWVRAVKTEKTRKHHIDVMLSKLSKGMRRPCCFNRNLCSEPKVSHNWVLLQPKEHQ